MALTAEDLHSTSLFDPENHIKSQDYYSRSLRSRFRLDGLTGAPINHSSGKYADIGYEFNEAMFQARTEARLQGGGLNASVPNGWPTKMRGPLVWHPDSFPNEDEYVYHLDDQDQAEICEALAWFNNQGLDCHEVSRTTFPLPRLSVQLLRLRDDIYKGRGFAIVRGLDPDAFLEEDMAIVYLGVSSYIAERRGKQDHRGSMLLHVMKRNDESDGQYSEDKPFHTDTVTDCLCLFTQSLAKTGGRSVLASSWTVYNELAATRPDLIHVLAQPDWPFDTYGRNPSYYKRALLYHHDEKLLMSFSRRLLVGHLPFEPRTKGIPGLTEAQAEALDAVHFIARKYEIKPRIMRGDIRFINNMAILHRREAFENSAENHRHLVRMWLNNPEACWKLPRPLQVAWARVFDDQDRDSQWDVTPVRMNGKILRVAGSCD